MHDMVDSRGSELKRALTGSMEVAQSSCGKSNSEHIGVDDLSSVLFNRKKTKTRLISKDIDAGLLNAHQFCIHTVLLLDQLGVTADLNDAHVHSCREQARRQLTSTSFP